MKIRTLVWIVAAATGLFLSLGCGGGGGGGQTPVADSRSFLMGFTPWPYAATTAAVADTYAKIQANGDMVVHHLDGGVPWPEAFAGQSAYSAALEGELAGRIANTQAGMPVVLAVCPLNTARNAPAGYWGSQTGQPRPAPWDAYDFGDAQLATAYIQFLKNLIDRFDPAYCNYGIEATEYIINNPGRAADLFAFLKTVYDALKGDYPDLPLFISVTLKSPGASDTALVQQYAADIAACTDLIGVSTYGYVFYGHAGSGDPANLPVDWLSHALDYAPGKPLAIAETGWIAQDLVIPTYGIDYAGTEAWQADYVELLMDEAQRLDAVLVTWFSAVDFDTLWTDTLFQDPLAQIWRDTGLYDATPSPRQALTVWRQWLAKPRQ